MRSWLRSRLGHVSRKRSLYEGDEPFFFLTEGLHGQIMFVGFGSPCRSDQSHPVRAGVSFPAQSFVSRPKFLPAPVLHIWIAPIFSCCFVLSSRPGGNGEQ